MTVILKLEYVSGPLIQRESLTGLVTRVPQVLVGLGQSLITHMAIQVCFLFYFFALTLGPFKWLYGRLASYINCSLFSSHKWPLCLDVASVHEMHMRLK